jgi:hypothetical protein
MRSVRRTLYASTPEKCLVLEGDQRRSTCTTCSAFYDTRAEIFVTLFSSGFDRVCSSMETERKNGPPKKDIAAHLACSGTRFFSL